jgi:excisionase family DNA binding protein
MAALDHSRAGKIRLVTDGKNMPSIELPPKALRMVANVLGMMAQRQPVMLLPQKLELSTQEAAAFLNVSRPFVVKQIDEGHLRCRKVGRHRRILFDDLMAYQQALHEETEAALQALADQAQSLGLDH